MVCSHDHEECKSALVCGAEHPQKQRGCRTLAGSLPPQRMMRAVSEDLSATGTRCVILDRSRKKVQRLMDEERLFLNDGPNQEKPVSQRSARSARESRGRGGRGGWWRVETQRSTKLLWLSCIC